jgi:DNA-binding NarL/FixJ family response regulator
VVEDHDSFRGIVCAALRSYLPGWEVLEAASVGEASALVSRRAVHVIASDFTLLDGTAKDLVDSLSPALSSSPRVIIFSNYTSDDLQPLLTRGEVHAFVPKESGVKALAETIQKESNPAR